MTKGSTKASGRADWDHLTVRYFSSLTACLELSKTPHLDCGFHPYDS